MSVLDPCARCRRHIRRGTSCPFCARRAAGLAVMVVAASVAAASCGGENKPDPVVPTDPVPTATQDPALPVATSDPVPEPTAAPTPDPAPSPTGTASGPTTDTDSRPVAEYGIPRPVAKYGIPRPQPKAPQPPAPDDSQRVAPMYGVPSP